MITIGITLMICCAVIILYSIYKWWEFKNPYIDEVYKETPIGPIYSPDDCITGYRMIYKRTYKNGTVRFISKLINNN